MGSASGISAAVVAPEAGALDVVGKLKIRMINGGSQFQLEMLSLVQNLIEQMRNEQQEKIKTKLGARFDGSKHASILPDGATGKWLRFPVRECTRHHDLGNLWQQQPLTRNRDQKHRSCTDSHLRSRSDEDCTAKRLELAALL